MDQCHVLPREGKGRENHDALYLGVTSTLRVCPSNQGQPSSLLLPSVLPPLPAGCQPPVGGSSRRASTAGRTRSTRVDASLIAQQRCI